MLCRFELVSDRKTKKPVLLISLRQAVLVEKHFVRRKVRNFSILAILSKFLAVKTRSDDG